MKGIVLTNRKLHISKKQDNMKTLLSTMKKFSKSKKLLITM